LSRRLGPPAHLGARGADGHYDSREPDLGGLAPDWDAVVIGAGPAGATAARELAADGRTVLLVEAARFPRDKVCGSCLGPRALAELAAAGLDERLDALGAPHLDLARVAAGGRCATVRLPPGRVLSRGALDLELLRAAARAGARVATGTRAELEPPSGSARPATRGVRLRRAGRERHLRARLVVACTGLGARDVECRVSPRSYIGAGALLDGADGAVPSGSVHLACGRGGYVGLTRLEDGRLDLAAALSAAAVRAAGGLAPLAAAILERSGLPAPAGLATARWRGTAALSRAPLRPYGHRLLAAGDAAGYVEPFTGEGIGWALAGGRAVGPLAREVLDGGEWSEQLGRRWQRTLRRVTRRRLACRALARWLRGERRTRLAIGLVARLPRLAGPLVSGGFGAPAPGAEAPR